jgi:NlpC/P60 family
MLLRTACALALSLCLLSSHATASDVVDIAASLIGRPYVWGAEGPRAFDCSGLTQYVFGKVGIDLPRRAINQSEIGAPSGRRLQRGDLLFFSSDARRSLVTHVGIYEGSGVMVNASKRHGRVRRDELSEEYWTERFMFARRVLAGGNQERPERDQRERTERRTSGRREAARALGRIAVTLLRRIPR